MKKVLKNGIASIVLCNALTVVGMIRQRNSNTFLFVELDRFHLPRPEL